MYVQAAGADQWPHHEVYVDPATFTSKTWAHPEDGVLHIFPANYWGNLQYRISGFDANRHAIVLGEGGWQINQTFQQADATKITEHSRFLVENLLEELDAPGEWYVDRRAGILYYMPPDEVDLSTALIEVSHYTSAIRFIGAHANPAATSGCRACVLRTSRSRILSRMKLRL